MKEGNPEKNEEKVKTETIKNYIEMNDAKKTQNKWRKRQNWDDKNYIEMNEGKKDRKQTKKKIK